MKATFTIQLILLLSASVTGLRAQESVTEAELLWMDIDAVDWNSNPEVVYSLCTEFIEKYPEDNNAPKAGWLLLRSAYGLNKGDLEIKEVLRKAMLVSDDFFRPMLFEGYAQVFESNGNYDSAYRYYTIADSLYTITSRVFNEHIYFTIRNKVSLSNLIFNAIPVDTIAQVESYQTMIGQLEDELLAADSIKKIIHTRFQDSTYWALEELNLSNVLFAYYFNGDKSALQRLPSIYSDEIKNLTIAAQLKVCLLSLVTFNKEINKDFFFKTYNLGDSIILLPHQAKEKALIDNMSGIFYWKSSQVALNARDFGLTRKALDRFENLEGTSKNRTLKMAVEMVRIDLAFAQEEFEQADLLYSILKDEVRKNGLPEKRLGVFNFLLKDLSINEVNSEFSQWGKKYDQKQRKLFYTKVMLSCLGIVLFIVLTIFIWYRFKRVLSHDKDFE